jgi:hypothetical protein
MQMLVQHRSVKGRSRTISLDKIVGVHIAKSGVQEPKVGLAVLESLELSVQLGRMPQIVGVQRRYELAGRALNRMVAGSGHAALRLSFQRHPRIVRCNVIHGRRRIVCRAMVYNNHSMRAKVCARTERSVSRKNWLAAADRL